MKRKLNIENLEEFNPWVAKSIVLATTTNYLDEILKIYPFNVATPQRLREPLRTKVIRAHSARDTEELIRLLKLITKFPYEDPVWYMLKNIKDCHDSNPRQIERIAESLYSMTAEETVIRLEAAPKINTQIGPMFTNWLRSNFSVLSLNEFERSVNGVHILGESEEVGKQFVQDELDQPLPKRPDLIAKVDTTYVIGEAKWIGQSGGNQEKQVKEVNRFCENQRDRIRRIGIVDGFPWSVYRCNGKLINDKVAVKVQESNYDIITALLLKEYLYQFKG